MFGFFRPKAVASNAPSLGIRLSSIPDVIYAIGDIHGCLDKLQRLQSTIIADAADIDGDKIIVTLGDYIDRGPASARTLDWLMQEAPPGFRRICLRGNHEALLLEALDKPGSCRDWLKWGGQETLRSYGIDPEYFERLSGRARGQVLNSFVPPDQVAFLRSCPYYLWTPGFLFVHAGIRPGIALEQQTARDMIWIGEPFLSEPHGLSEIVVHGHTRTPEPVIGPSRIAIDTGAFAGGPLTALKLTAGGEISFLSAD